MGDNCLDKKEYRKYRTVKDDNEHYFPEGTLHEDEQVQLNGMVFNWDKTKNEANKLNHGIDFYTAVCVFNDDYYEADSYLRNGELRNDIIGEPMKPSVKNHPIDTGNAKPKAILGKCESILFVTFTENETETGNLNRIISARPANKKEVENYWVYVQGF